MAKSTLIHIIVALIFAQAIEAASPHINIPRAPKGGSSGGGGGRGGGSGRGSSSSSSTRGAGTGRGGSGDTGRPPIAITYSNRQMNYFSWGGGSRFTIPAGSPFAGREMGGGTRAQVPGTPRYASGYPYYSYPPRQGVFTQPFPFGFWPMIWIYHGHGGVYRDPSVEGQRPGGPLVVVNLDDAPDAGWNTTTINGVDETYWMAGDQESVSTMLSLLVDPQNTSYGCGVQNKTIQPFTYLDSNTSFSFPNVIQYYRASSFLLAFTGYNNTFSFPPQNETTEVDWLNSTPLPDRLVYSPFLQCINKTLIEALPILDGDPQTGLSDGEIAGIVIGCIVGVILLGIAAWFGWKIWKVKRRLPKKF